MDQHALVCDLKVSVLTRFRQRQGYICNVYFLK